ncbi:hypothetical protein NL676_023032 [Syzygium grande]|nr:hypothetical protein NL676_023032 [Syzygium grande]
MCSFSMRPTHRTSTSRSPVARGERPHEPSKLGLKASPMNETALVLGFHQLEDHENESAPLTRESRPHSGPRDLLRPRLTLDRRAPVTATATSWLPPLRTHIDHPGRPKRRGSFEVTPWWSTPLEGPRHRKAVSGQWQRSPGLVRVSLRFHFPLAV